MIHYTDSDHLLDEADVVANLIAVLARHCEVQVHFKSMVLGSLVAAELGGYKVELRVRNNGQDVAVSTQPSDVCKRLATSPLHAAA